MIIFKPDWVSHADKAQEAKGKKPCIYSVHVHPDGTRLATGSLDTTIKIWNTKPIYHEESEKDLECNKLLCTMTMHNGAVLCVRWSNREGQYLASSSDSDNVIIIWERDVNVKEGNVFGSSEVNYETWKPVKYLRGHESDVQDLAWSKDNQYLASCGVDGFVIVWDGKTFEQVKKIDRHEGFVKGITWDPAGKYLASQSDDKTVKIWRTADWGLETVIKNPFVNAPGTTLFRRLSWSPDGCHISAANAVNSIKCIAAIIGREDWNTDISLVGHQLPIEITSFNPKMFNMADESVSSQSKSMSSICALGSQDRSISIWTTKFSKPICVAADIFDNYVYDIAWAPDGKSLFACSQDGTVACLQFQEELDDIASEQAVISKLEKYGYGKRQAQLVETPIQMELENKILETNPPLPQRVADLMQGNTTNRRNEVTGSTLTSSTIMRPTVTEQKISVSKSGKRRIQPVSLSTTTSSVAPTSVQIITKEKTDASDIPSTETKALVIGNKRRAVDPDEDGLVNRVEGNRSNKIRPDWIDSTLVPCSQKSMIKLSIPKVKTVLSNKAKSQDPSVVLECHSIQDSDSLIRAKLVITKQGERLWMDYLPSTVLVMTSNTLFSAVGCEDGCIYVYSSAGRRLLPAIVLESIPVLLQCMDQWLICITSTGVLYSWDMLNKESHIQGVSIAPVLQTEQQKDEEKPARIKDVRIQKNGLPILLTAAHQAFVYHVNMKAWTRISDAWYIISEFWGNCQEEDHPLAWLSSRMAIHGIDGTTRALLNNNTATISHIEAQLAVVALLSLPEEYINWVMYYAKRLSEENATNKVQELCRWLKGPPISPFSEPTPWEPTIMGQIPKIDLLKKILPLLRENDQLQQTLTEFDL